MEFLNTAEKRDRRMVHIPMGRFGEAIEQAQAALFRESRATGKISVTFTNIYHASQLRQTRVATLP